MSDQDNTTPEFDSHSHSAEPNQGSHNESNQPERRSEPTPEPSHEAPSHREEQSAGESSSPRNSSESSPEPQSTASPSGESEPGQSDPQPGNEARRDSRPESRPESRTDRFRNQRGQRNQGRNRGDNRNRGNRPEQNQDRTPQEPESTEREGNQIEQRPEREQRTDRDQRQDRNRGNRADRGERPDRGDRNDRGERNGRPDRGERGDRGDRNERNDRNDRNRGDRQSRPDGRSALAGSDISIVVPLFNEEQSLRELYDRIYSVVGRHSQYEIIFVDDGSTDGSNRVLQELRNKDRKVKIIRFRRNFGKSAALAVGFQHAKGDIVITMDSDLQDDPNEIPALVNEIKKGYDLVSGWKKKRHDPITKTVPSKFFNFVTSMMTGIKLHDFNCGLKAYRKDVVKEVKLYGELHRYIPVLAHWRGFKVGEIAVQHHARKYGKTKFGIGRFWKGFLDLIGVLFTTRYMQRPLHLFGFWGSVAFLIGVATDGWLATEKLVWGVSLSNRPLFTGGVLLIIVGIQLMSLGLIGEMIVKYKHDDSDFDYSIKEISK